MSRFLYKPSKNKSVNLAVRDLGSNWSRLSAFLSSKPSLKFLSLRHSFKKTEKQIKLLKFIRLNSLFSRSRRNFASLQLDFLKSISLTRLKNLSVLTLKAKSFSKEFSISRVSFRKLASSGYISGVSKASW